MSPCVLLSLLLLVVVADSEARVLRVPPAVTLERFKFKFMVTESRKCITVNLKVVFFEGSRMINDLQPKT